MEAVNKHKSLILVIFNIELEVEFFYSVFVHFARHYVHAC